MATDLERLVVQLSADVKGYENAMRRAQGVTTRQTRAIESQWTRMNRRLSTGFAGLSRTFAAAFAGAAATRGAQALIDAATRIDNALKVAGLSGEELNKVYGRLRDSAIRNAAPLESLVELYGRAALVQKELGVTGEELLGFTDNIAVALRVSGKSAAEASGALLQLSQALGSGVVRAEEFNSILEGALPIAQAAAAGLEEAGGSVAKLRQLVVDGKISSEAFFRAFEAGAPILQEKVAGATLTISQRMTNLQTALIDAAKEFNNSTQAANTFGEAIDNVTSFVNGIDFDALIDRLGEVIAQFQAGIRWAQNFAAAVAEASGLDSIGGLLTGGAAQRSFLGGALTVTSSKALRDRIAAAHGGPLMNDPAVEALLRERYSGFGSAAAKSGRLGTSSFTPVSLADFSTPGGDDKKKGGSRESPFDREARQIRERTEAIRAETAALAGLNPLVDDYGFAIERASAVQELLNAAKRQGLEITPELRASIEQLATGYANASVAAAQLAESQERVRQTAEDFRDLGKDVMSGFISDIRQGTSAAEALSNALGKVVDKLLDMALTSAFSGGGLFGGILGSIFHDGGVVGSGGKKRRVHPAMFAGAPRYHQGGVAGLRPGEVPAILQRGEIVLPKGSSAVPGPQAVRVTVGVDVDKSGNIRPFVTEVSQSTTARGIAAYDRGKERQRMTGG